MSLSQLIPRPLRVGQLLKGSSSVSFTDNQIPGNIVFANDEITSSYQFDGRESYLLKSGRTLVKADAHCDWYLFDKSPADSRSCVMLVEADHDLDVWQFDVQMSAEEITDGVFVVRNETVVNGQPYLEAETIPGKFAPIGVNWMIAGEDGELKGLDYIANDGVVDLNKGGSRPEYIVISINPDIDEGETVNGYKVDKLFIDTDIAPEFIVLQCYYATKSYFSAFTHLQSILS